MSFICKSCLHELNDVMCMRTESYCYMCDPNITLDELLSDEPILDKQKTDLQEETTFFNEQISILKLQTQVKELKNALNGFINSVYVGCSKKELETLRVNAEKLLNNEPLSSTDETYPYLPNTSDDGRIY